jgi:hypothetical protein
MVTKVLLVTSARDQCDFLPALVGTATYARRSFEFLGHNQSSAGIATIDEDMTAGPHSRCC